MAQDGTNLVSEARPIPLAALSEFERTRIREINARVEAIIVDARERYVAAKDSWRKPVPGIDGHRTGRSLLIDGDRGTGKTSLLLTLLKHWQAEDASDSIDDIFWPKREAVSVFLPVLDFDPLPPGMPLHGWLLQPWRSLVDTSNGADEDLQQAWADLFDQAVIGWGANVDGKTMVERALGYQDQTSGWHALQRLWRAFVNRTICHKLGCPKERCIGKDHGLVFIVAIDDVDLQVTRLSELLHAIRLLHHPNVLYVLTGNFEHMGLVTELDYLREHASGLPVDLESVDRLFKEVRDASKRLRGARLEKALPSHARFRLRELTLREVLDLPVDRSAVTTRVTDVLDDANGLGKQLAELVGATGASNEDHEKSSAGAQLEVVSVRRAQHAIDRRRKTEHPSSKARAAWLFAADLAGGSVAAPDSAGVIECRLRGALTTQPGQPSRVWDARDGLQVAVAPDVRFAFRVDNDVRYGADAHRALLLQLILEHAAQGGAQVEASPPIRAPWLEWIPDAGIIWTRHPWRPSGPFPLAIFHWPWLRRPTASDALKEFRSWFERLRGNTAHAQTWTKDDRDVVATWIAINFKKHYPKEFLETQGASEKTDSPPSIEAMLDKLAQVRKASARTQDTSESGLSEEDDDTADIEEWAIGLAIMTTPHFGLTFQTRKTLWNALKPFGLTSDRQKLLDEYIETVRNALLWGAIENGDGARLAVREPELHAEQRAFSSRFLRGRNSTWWDALEDARESAAK